MMSFLDQNSILSDSQYGFRKGRSADLAILTLTEKKYESVEKDEFLIGIFLNLSKAFDTLSHTILLNKLSYYGFRGIASDWIANYLTSRKQFVSYNNYDSYVSDVKIGVPQGSILLKPHFTYCLTSWGSTTKSRLNVLFLLQKKIVRILTGSDYHAHSESLFIELKIMNVFQLHRYFTGILVYKSIYNMYFKYWNNLFHQSNNLRFPNDLKICKNKDVN